MTEYFLIYGAVGTLVGILAGLLGVGGGGVIVPLLVFVFHLQGVADQVTMHLALGTSLACIVFTSISSFLAHHRRGAVHWPVVRHSVVGIVVGTLAGAGFAAVLSTGFLKGFFVLFLYFVAIQMLINRPPKPSRELPGLAGMSAVGLFIGFLSSLVGIGGGSLSVPFMVWCNITVHQAIGTSAAIGLPIAAAGTLGYLVSGWQATALPPYSIGYIYLPALVGIAAVSILTAPLGARLAHSLPVSRLRKIFAVMLIVIGTRMLFSIF
ncbi:sulfite exporter TauE/SafE family protein [Desulfofustis limnaeus]|jgi:uncharacterized membrane protein YfcA|uniref:Probable membrane transporter protein n=1 Tax=Desulfofustis limnaeus TaxID=2740163 RepID=A0ABN6M4U6_9BACT|nr:sulfite exporter TauE/SafE family protein [Desulfofustis limnaeus]MDX9897243.1 sulfite exporter TauE/SafE family protein [Desulfofustis sp.]BDD87923.1 UPF0721 transmembrane protein [Desulfofustis limnaeus]